MKLMERAKMLNVPDISGSVFRLIYDAVDANDIAPCLLDRKYLRNVINNYIDCEADEIDEDEQGDFIDLGREAMDQFETLEDSEIVVLLAMVQGFSLVAAQLASGMTSSPMFTAKIPTRLTKNRRKPWRRNRLRLSIKWTGFGLLSGRIRQPIPSSVFEPNPC